MKPARGGGDEEAPRQNGAAGLGKGEQQQGRDGDEDDGGSAFGLGKGQQQQGRDGDEDDCGSAFGLGKGEQQQGRDGDEDDGGSAFGLGKGEQQQGRDEDEDDGGFAFGLGKGEQQQGRDGDEDDGGSAFALGKGEQQQGRDGDEDDGGSAFGLGKGEQQQGRDGDEDDGGSAFGLGKGEQQQGRDRDEDDGGFAFGPADLQDADSDPSLRRELRSKYRDLISSVQQNREEMLNPSTDKLSEVLEEANKLFKDVRQAREAALDARLLVTASDLGKEKASQMFAESMFDLSAFTEHLLTIMGLNRLENGEDEQQNGGAVDGYLPQDAWHRVARRAECCFRTAPTFHYMLGSFRAEPPRPKQRIERRKALSKEAKRIMPTQLKKMEESHQEATEKEVERILGFLKSYYQDDPTLPISYYEFVIDPDSFSQTVENIFHTSFLIRDGLARMYLDTAKLPCIAPVEEGEVEAGESSSLKQCIVSISKKTWKELIDALDISDTMIPPSNTQNE